MLIIFILSRNITLCRLCNQFFQLYILRVHTTFVAFSVQHFKLQSHDGMTCNLAGKDFMSLHLRVVFGFGNLVCPSLLLTDSSTSKFHKD